LPLEIWAKWDPQGVPGTFRFLTRLWNLVQEFLETDKDPGSEEQTELLQSVNKTIVKVTDDLEHQDYNTAIAAMMQCVNDMYKFKVAGFKNHGSWQFALESLAMMVAPFAPHIAEELWHQLGHEDSVHVDHWPKHEDKYLKSNNITLVVQINGKVRANIIVPVENNEEQNTESAKNDEKINEILKGKEIVKTIYVEGRLINFVIK
jgi:leucyl-tRNA synthetase